MKKPALSAIGVDAFIVTNPVNIFYLTGFTGISPTERESILVLRPEPVLIVPKLYQTEAKKLASAGLKIEIAVERNKLNELIAKLLKGAKKIGFEEANLTYAEFSELNNTFKKSELVPIKNIIENLRLYKNKDELKRIEKAQTISQKAFAKLVPTIKIGQTEVEIAEKLEKIMKSLGADGASFPTIVASGKNAALPHYLTGKAKVAAGHVLLLDFGAKYQNYCADITRTIFVGKANDEQINTYNLVKKAQSEAIRKISAGTRAKTVHNAAVAVFKAVKQDGHFLHSLGHGIGLEVHEQPYLRASAEVALEESMVFSIEPGLYFPAWGGVRIEDLITIKAGRPKVLGKLSEEIIIIN